MSLESLPNELLLDMFQYLPAVQLLRAFHGVNTRFDNLIFTHFRIFRLDFRAASKKDFDSVCQVNLPLIIDQIVSLGLSDDDETPEQIYLFRSYVWNFNQFQSLRSLLLDHIRSGEIISDILLECPHLTNLNLTECYFGCKQDDILRFVNSIWSLPKLIYCYLDMDLKYGLNIPTPTYFSLSMEHLSIIGVPYRISYLTYLFQHTPHLRYIALDLYRIRNDEELQISISSITKLNLVFLGPEQGTIENLLQHMPNLYQLKIATCYIEMNGYEWEQIIRNYLPKLKVFQLKMSFEVIGEKCKEELFNSFQTRFWLEENHWFVRYHYNSDDRSNMICLYTLPYSFINLIVLFPTQLKSTCPNQDDYRSYDRVEHLLYHSSSIEEMIASNFNFPHINHLSVKFPINNHLLSIIQKLDRLTLLEVSRSNNMLDADAKSQLQALLMHAPYLHSLKFNSWSGTQQHLTPIIMKTRLIRRLNLFGYDHWFNDEECTQLTYSLRGIDCEVLFIKVMQRTNILYLINTMRNLRALIVRCQDDDWINYSSSADDDLVQWLQQKLPPMCSIKLDSRFVHHIRIWIHL